VRLLALVLLAACAGGPADDDKPGDESDADADADADADTDTDTDVPVDADEDGYTDDVDCDDGDADVNPGAVEVCDLGDVDEDCDGRADNADDSTADFITLYRDADADGFGDGNSAEGACEVVAGYTTDASDCDDGKAAIHPGATELCDAADTDEDCDALADDADTAADGKVPTYTDLDGDGWGDAATETLACDGGVAVPGDCDDADAAVSPDGVEACNAVDDDCDGATDEPDAVDAAIWHFDGDDDGYGAPDVTEVACDLPAGFVADASDCDDADAAVSPAGVEVCNELDDDCDGAVDPDSSAGAPAWYADADGDSYGDAAATRIACDAPAGYLADATDCDDAAPGTHPGATEQCDAADTDEDCDGNADDADPGADAASMTAWYTDGDDDGYGDPASEVLLCDALPGWIADAGDCDDDDAAVSPAGAEVCDAADADEDCDGAADDADTSVDTTTRSTWYRDVDGDGYAGSALSTGACDQPTGYRATATDCDDADRDVSPGATERCDADDTDEDCDGLADDADRGATGGTWHPDLDGDGFGDEDSAYGDAAAGLVTDAEDCRDDDEGVYPDAPDTCGDGLDADCDGFDACELTTAMAGTTYYGSSTNGYLGYSVAIGDADGDGFDDVLTGATADDSGATDGGAAYLFAGNTTGTFVAGTDDVARFLGTTANGALGRGVAMADLDGDGDVEVALGSPYTEDYYGTVRLFDGPVSGSTTSASATTSWSGRSMMSYFGMVLRTGDVTGDGVVELLASGGGYSSGGILVFQSPTAGSFTAVTDADARLSQGSLMGAGNAFEVADLDGDGVDDLCFGAPYAAGYEGQVGVLYGPLVGTVEADAADVIVTGDGRGRSSSGAEVGSTVACGGDADGDGHGDLLAGAYMTANDGYAYWWGAAPAGDSMASAADATFDGNDRTGSYLTFGSTVETGGDLNGDGFDDLAIADANNTEGVYLWLGGAGFGGAQTRDDADLTVSVPYTYALAFTDGFDDDGDDDLVVGAISARNDAGTMVGAVYVFGDF
jgi:hypothetical protein